MFRTCSIIKFIPEFDFVEPYLFIGLYIFNPFLTLFLQRIGIISPLYYSACCNIMIITVVYFLFLYICMNIPTRLNFQNVDLFVHPIYLFIFGDQRSFAMHSIANSSFKLKKWSLLWSRWLIYEKFLKVVSLMIFDLIW